MGSIVLGGNSFAEHSENLAPVGLSWAGCVAQTIACLRGLKLQLMRRQTDPSVEDLLLPTSDVSVLVDSTSRLVNASFSSIKGKEAALRFPKCDLAQPPIDPLIWDHIVLGPFLLIDSVATPALVPLRAMRSDSDGRDIWLEVGVCIVR